MDMVIQLMFFSHNINSRMNNLQIYLSWILQNKSSDKVILFLPLPPPPLAFFSPICDPDLSDAGVDFF
jgi:hypothetical protein